jgi:ABC-type uncharacterized transport system fused permease/ATPase subunit
MKIRDCILEATLTIFPFIAGASICLDALHRQWIALVVLVAVSIILIAAQLHLYYYRRKLTEFLQEHFEEARDIVKESRQTQGELLFSTTALLAILAGLVGLTVNFKVIDKPARRTTRGR